jgi:hypothetical protein
MLTVVNLDIVIIGSIDPRFPCGDELEYSTIALRVVEGVRKGTQCLGL